MTSLFLISYCGTSTVGGFSFSLQEENVNTTAITKNKTLDDFTNLLNYFVRLFHK
ncbi:hypothetical protein MASR1M107_16080 [Ignavibacteriales bacterium]